MTKVKLDMLAFGAHPDDVEIGMAGTIIKYVSKGKKIGICDLTEAELSSNGTVMLRKKEANRAAEILGIGVRDILQMPDRGLLLNEKTIKQVVDIIRKYQPNTVFAPYFEDRHPDHGNCSKIIVEAVFSAAIKKYQTESSYEPHRVKNVYFYMINGFHKPDFVIDISKQMPQKIESLQAYESQFVKSAEMIDTPLVNGYIETVEARERMFGKEVGVAFAEGFKTSKPLLYELQ